MKRHDPPQPPPATTPPPDRSDMEGFHSMADSGELAEMLYRLSGYNVTPLTRPEAKSRGPRS